MAEQLVNFYDRIMTSLFKGKWLVAFLIFGCLGLRLADPPMVEKLRFMQFDLFQELAPRTGGSPPIAIIDIDESSLTKIGQWPWSRTVLADLVDKLHAAGAVAIGFDATFPEPDRTSPQWLVDALPDLTSATKAELNAKPSNDVRFADSMRGRQVVLGIAGSDVPVTGNAPPKVTPLAEIGGNPRPFLFNYPGIVSNVGELDAAAAGRGVFSLLPERDGVVRRMPAVIRVANQVYPAFFIELLRVALGEPSFAIRSNAGGVDSLIIARNRIPTDSNGTFWVHYQRRDPSIYISAAKMLEGTVPPEKIAGKIVLVGTSATGLGDIRATPSGISVPGVEIHWQSLGAILAGDFLTRPPYATHIELVAIGVIGVLIMVVMSWLRARWTAVLLFGLLATVTGFAWYAYEVQGLLFDAVYPSLAIILIYMAQVYFNHYASERQRRQVSEAFGRYVSPVLVQRLSKDPTRLQLGGETKNMTILFCDIRGFTRISEKLKGNPQGLTTLINRFLTPLSEEVMRHNGTIDKYIGDCLMAFWNAPLDDPDHARNACTAALDMYRALDRLNEELAQEARANVAVDHSAKKYRRLKELADQPLSDSERAQLVSALRSEASEGSAYSQYVLGKAYRDGLVGQRNLDEAVRWFSAAASQGFTPAQRNIGERLARGDGVAPDQTLAFVWLTLASRDGLAAAEEARVELMQRMSVAEIAAAERRARSWRPVGLQQGYLQIGMGVGINTGECVVGNMGSRLRFDYSVLGDSVNVAARLEAQSSNYGVGIVISEMTCAEVPDFATIELDRVVVKGKSEPLRVFGLIGGPEVAQSEPFQSLSWRHKAMLQAYRERQWDEAAEHLDYCRDAWPDLDPLYELYRDRIENFRANPPSQDWDGVYVALRK